MASRAKKKRQQRGEPEQLSDYRDKMTLDEVAKNDREMVKVAIKKAKRYKHFKKEEAFQFQGHCVQTTMEYCGVKIVPGMKPKMVDRLLETHKVVVEQRKKYSGEDQWRNGIYIYKNGEMVAFVSNVFHYQRPSIQIAGDPDHWFIITNAKVFNGRRIFT